MSTVLAVAGIWIAASAVFGGLIALTAHVCAEGERRRAARLVIAQAEQICRNAARTTH